MSMIPVGGIRQWCSHRDCLPWVDLMASCSFPHFLIFSCSSWFSLGFIWWRLLCGKVFVIILAVREWSAGIWDCMALIRLGEYYNTTLWRCCGDQPLSCVPSGAADSQNSMWVPFQTAAGHITALYKGKECHYATLALWHCISGDS